MIWQYGFLHISEEGLRMGSYMAARLVFLIIFSSLLTYTTSPIRLTDGIEHLLNPFRRFGVPAHELAMMMTIALRFIPTLLEETDRIMKAQASRGADFTTGSLVKRAKIWCLYWYRFLSAPSVVPMNCGVAMEARCYRGGENRTRMKELTITSYDYIGIAASGDYCSTISFTLCADWLRRVVIGDRTTQYSFNRCL